MSEKEESKKKRVKATEETFRKETKKVKTKLIRDTLGFMIMIVFLILVYLFRLKLSINYQLVMIIGGAYLAYVIYKLLNNYKRYYTLTDELRLDEEDILKYNPIQGKVKKRIPIENVDRVFFDIDDHPNTLYVVYTKKGNKAAENFYKNNVTEKEDVMDYLRDNNLLDTDPVSIPEMKEKMGIE